MDKLTLSEPRSDAARTTATDRIRLKGTLRNFNTIEEFKQVDKARLLEELGDQVRESAVLPVRDTH